jgi:hypothetical protein
MTWNIYFLILFYNIELLKIRFYNLFWFIFNKVILV